MSFECPHLLNGICQLNHMSCTPGKGQCVLRGKVKMVPKTKLIDELQEQQKDSDKKSSDK
ncbi:hypothetical protein JW960_26750 [candidate division KSB1 bacterium]|nr:hypothetical protein [candidate division KSB1 bacterium]